MTVQPLDLVQHVAPLFVGCRLQATPSMGDMISADVEHVVDYWNSPFSHPFNPSGWVVGPCWDAAAPEVIVLPYAGIWRISCSVTVQTTGLPGQVRLRLSGGAGLNIQRFAMATWSTGDDQIMPFGATTTIQTTGPASVVLSAIYHTSDVSAPTSVIIGWNDDWFEATMLAAAGVLAGPTGVCASIVQPQVLGPVDLCRPHEENYEGCWTPTCVAPQWESGSTLYSHILYHGHFDWLTGSTLASQITQRYRPQWESGVTWHDPLVLWQHAQLETGSTLASVVVYHGVIVHSIDLDGSTASIDFGTGAQPPSGSSWSLSYWLKTPTSQFAPLLDFGGFNSGIGGSSWEDAAGFSDLGIDSNSVESFAAVGDNAWHNVVCTYDSSTQIGVIYIDGAISTSGADVLGPYGYDGLGLVMGTTNAAPPTWWRGKVTQPAVWWTTLTAGNAASLAAGTDPLTIGTPQMFADFTEGGGSVVHDRTSNHDDGTCLGGFTWDSDKPSVL